jgi:hypothetical protein
MPQKCESEFCLVGSETNAQTWKSFHPSYTSRLLGFYTKSPRIKVQTDLNHFVNRNLRYGLEKSFSHLFSQYGPNVGPISLQKILWSK